MSKSLKIILIAVSGFVGLLVCVAAALLLFVDANACKSRLEATASGVLGMEVRVGGRLGIDFFPGLLVTLEDVHIRNQGVDVAFAKEAGFKIDLLPLLQKEVRIGKIALKYPSIFIERDLDGKFNFEKSEAPGGTLPALNLAIISLSDGTLFYADKQANEGFEAGDCNLDVRRLQLSRGERPELLKNLSFTAELACGEARAKDFAASDVKFSAALNDGVLDIKPVLMGVLGGQGSGSIRVDFTDVIPLYHIRYSLSQFMPGEFLKAKSPNSGVEGTMDFSADLEMRGNTVSEMRETVAGQISLRGENLKLNGSNLDQTLSRFESSQNFNLVDVGAFFFAGPIGLVLTKGYNFASIFQGSGGRSEIRMLVSDWKVERGVARAQDVAMATNENRIALQGALDFVNERFVDVTVALLDAQGCAKVRQKIRGTFKKPMVEKPGILRSLAGPVINLFKKGRNFFPGGKCEVFYAGSVAALK